jgi:hypothetical protein
MIKAIEKIKKILAPFSAAEKVEILKSVVAKELILDRKEFRAAAEHKLSADREYHGFSW